ncbi:MAG: glycosyltransferase family 1 protein [Bacteroidales bacterium]
MRIAVNTRLLLPGRLEGIGWFTYETMQRIVLAHPQHTFYFLFDRKWSKEFIFAGNVVPICVFPPTRHPLLWYLWLEWALPRVLKKIRADVFLSPDGFLSLSTKVPSVAVIHDLNFQHRPQDLPFLTRSYYRYFFPRFARKAVGIATVSEFSKRDLINTYGIDPSRIDITFNGANGKYKPLTDTEKEKVKNTYTAGEEYFIFVGALHPRKNIPRLLKAYEIYRSRPGSRMKLLIVGARMFGNRELTNTLAGMNHRSDVLFTGRLPAEDLHLLMGAAQALVFVPLFEGFGIPVLEAMQCDVPVIASNVTSMPEVAGNAALYADPESVESIAGAMIRITEEPQLRRQLIEHGRKRRTMFSWDLTARRLWECLEKTLTQNPAE